MGLRRTIYNFTDPPSIKSKEPLIFSNQFCFRVWMSNVCQQRTQLQVTITYVQRTGWWLQLSFPHTRSDLSARITKWRTLAISPQKTKICSPLLRIGTMTKMIKFLIFLNCSKFCKALELALLSNKLYKSSSFPGFRIGDSKRVKTYYEKQFMKTILFV
jgi:hypothetical protein